MTQHIHHDLIVQWAKDTSRVVEYFSSAGRWIKDSNPSWHPDLKFRIRHKHQDLIDQKAARPELIVEMKTRLGVWVRMDMVLWDMVLWDENNEYRLVEPPKKKVKMWQWVIGGEDWVWLSELFFADAPKVGDSEFVIQRADWTEIEVDE